MCWGERVGSCYALKDDQLDCPPPNGLNHYLPLNTTGAHSTGERFRATMAHLFLNFIYNSVCLFIDTIVLNIIQKQFQTISDADYRFNDSN